MKFPLRAAVRAGEWLAVSGQLGLKDGALVEGGALEQMHQAIANFAAVLEDHGLTLGDVVKTTVFMVDMDDYADMNEAYASAFTSEPPARSAVAVAGLPLGGLVEIEGWARHRVHSEQRRNPDEAQAAGARR